MKTNQHTRYRPLRAEHLEKRELLAADLTGAIVLPPDTSQFNDVAIVAAEVDDTPQERERNDNSSVPDDVDPALKRPQDRDSQDDTVTASTSLVVTAAAEVDDTPQERERNDNSSVPDDVDPALKRPQDRDSQDDSVTGSTSLAAGVGDVAFEATAVRGGSNEGEGQQSPSSSELSMEETENLLFVREEEKLARDVYLILAEKWDVPIFTNIAQSEQQHMDAVGQLIEKYGLEDPIKDDTRGVFANPTLQRLYNDLVSSSNEPVGLEYLGLDLKIEGGGTSELAALKVGAFIEEFDIIDILQHTIADTSHSDIENVYENLLRGSRSHLRSFVGQIEVTGDTYTPVMMTGLDPVTGVDLDALYLEIISGDHETANGRGSGRQQGQTGPQRLQTASGPSIVAIDQIFAGYGRSSSGKRS